MTTPRYYGWNIVGALSITETISWGILYYTFSVFVVPVREETGWSLAFLTGAYSLALLVSGVLAPFVGRVIDHHGPRWIMTAGSVIGALGVLTWSRADTRWTYYLAWVAIGIAMSATLYEPAFTTLTRWFRRKRARAMLIVTIAAGFASTIFLPLAGVLEEQVGWRTGTALLAALIGGICVPLHALVLRRRPEDLGLEVDGEPSVVEEGTGQASPDSPGLSLSEATRSATFWWLAFGFCLQSFATAAVALILIPYLTDRGESPAYAASIVGLIGAAQVGSRILSTAFGHLVPLTVLTAIVFGLQAVAVSLLLMWDGGLGLVISVLILGAGRGAVTLVRPQLVADLYGAVNFGVINGTLAGFLIAANALAPIASGLIYGLTDDYAPILWGMVAVSVLSALAMVFVRGSQPPSERYP